MGKRRQYAGKLGPWARGGCVGTRYLDTGLQGRPVYSRIVRAEPEGGQWRWVRVWLEAEHQPSSEPRSWQVVRWCGCNTYE